MTIDKLITDLNEEFTFLKMQYMPLPTMIVVGQDLGSAIFNSMSVYCTGCECSFLGMRLMVDYKMEPNSYMLARIIKEGN